VWFVPPAHAEDVDLPVLVAPADLAIRKSDPPRFPSDPTAPAARCLVRVVIDQAGVPAEMDTKACSPTYAALAEDGIRHWRWEAPRGPLGKPAEAVVLVPVTFTPPGRAPIEPAERCTFTLDVASTGAVRVTGQSAPQCVVWAPASTARPPAVGMCGVAVQADLARTSAGWVDLSACPPEGQAFASALLSHTLFSTGTISTRLMFVLPDPSTAPPSMVFDVASPTFDTPTRLTRDAGDAPASLDPPLEMKETELPEVDLSALLDPSRLPSKEHDPQPEPPPE
jgi:hypothetical protein